MQTMANLSITTTTTTTKSNKCNTTSSLLKSCDDRQSSRISRRETEVNNGTTKNLTTNSMPCHPLSIQYLIGNHDDVADGHLNDGNEDDDDGKTVSSTSYSKSTRMDEIAAIFNNPLLINNNVSFSQSIEHLKIAIISMENEFQANMRKLKNLRK